jgi:hypothetical protein
MSILCSRIFPRGVPHHLMRERVFTPRVKANLLKGEADVCGVLGGPIRLLD